MGIAVLSSPVAMAETLTLRHVGSTTIQIALSWTPVDDAIEYILERSPSEAFSPLTTFTLPPSLTSYGDTGTTPEDARRFWEPPRRTSTLVYGTPYHYRLRARVASALDLVSNTVSASLSGPPNSSGLVGQRDRVVGDLWADVVLGQPNFAEYVMGRPAPGKTDLAGGLVIDRNTQPERLYVIDANHNRILGFDHIVTDPDAMIPAVVLGQPTTSTAACNGDATNEAYPNVTPPSARSLCLTGSGGISPREAVLMSNLAVDATHHLYVADVYNHRVLKYHDPMTTDVIADVVWGQEGSFATRDCNRGTRSAGSLCLSTVGGLEVEATPGHLWVVDGGNNRVLRFPSGHMTADVVLGQNSFTSYQDAIGPNSLRYLVNPSAVRVDAAGNVYVAELGGNSATHLNLPSRVLFYSAQAIAASAGTGQGVDATRILLQEPQQSIHMPTTLALDPVRNGLWVQSNGRRKNHFYDFGLGQMTKTIGTGSVGNFRGLDVDAQGNVYVIDAWDPQTLRRHTAADVNQGGISPAISLTAGWPILRAGKDPASLNGLQGVTGMVLAGQQLLVSDLTRVLFWNDAQTVTTGQPADGTWDYGYWNVNTGPLGVDGSGRIWLASRGVMNAPGQPCGPWCLRAFQAPLRSNSASVRSLWMPTLQTKEGQAFTVVYQDFLPFAPIGSGDRMWVGTVSHGVVRLVNIDGLEDSTRGPYVDVVLGRQNLTTAPCDASGAYQRSVTTICQAARIRLDHEGHLWVEDKPVSQDGIGPRLLRFDAATIPAQPANTVYGIAASAVYGTGNQFNAGTDCYYNSPIDFENGCHPYLPTLHPAGLMVTGTNAYTSSRFGLVWPHYAQNSHPQLALGDLFAFLTHGLFDADGNLYLGDWNWNRVLIYKRPFQALFSNGGGGEGVVTGDLNADTFVDALDLQLLVNVFLLLETDPDILARADLDGQGVQASDLQLLVNLLLGE